MRSTRWCRVSWSLLLAGLGAVASAADEKAGDPVLTGKGLTKQGSNYTLVEDEKPVLAKLREARGAFKDLAAMAGEKGNNQQLAAQAEELEQQRAMLQSQLDALTLQISQQPAAGPGGLGGYGGVGGVGGVGGIGGFGSGGAGGFGYGGQAAGPSPLMVQREQVRLQLLQITNAQRTVKNAVPQGKDNAALEKRTQKAQEGFKATLADLRKQVDEVQKKYTTLEADAAVKNALTEARKTNGRVKVGPSDAFVAATRELDKAERQFLDRKPASSSAATAKKKAAPKAKK